MKRQLKLDDLLSLPSSCIISITSESEKYNKIKSYAEKLQDMAAYISERPKYGTVTHQHLLACVQNTRTLIHCYWECKMGKQLWKMFLKFLTELNINKSAHWHLPNGSENLHLYTHTKVYSKFIHNCLNLKALRHPSVSERLNELWHI